MILSFLLLLAIVAFAYFGYPLLLLVVAAWRREPHLADSGGDLPSVTLLIVAYNEERVLEAKLENSLGLDYPRDRLEIVVASDASTDRTDDIARAWERRGVRLIRRPQRGSQTGAQNYAAPRTSGRILVFSDANSIYAPDALRHLAARFAEPSVGCVVGRLLHSNAASTAVSFGEEMYWRYESLLKRIQSRAGALLFASGAIYAVRRELYRPLDGDWDHDTMVPLRCIEAGRRVVYEPRARAWEEAGTDVRPELRRKVRIIVRDARTLLDLVQTLRRGRAWVRFNVICHKVVRWLVWLPLCGMLVAAGLGVAHPFLRAALVLQLTFYSAALAAQQIERRRPAPPWLRLPLYFCLVNIAGLLATARVLRGERQTFWNPRSGDR